MNKPLRPEVLHKVNVHSRATNYLPVGQSYLYDHLLLPPNGRCFHIALFIKRTTVIKD